jgi:hypothetical protein
MTKKLSAKAIQLIEDFDLASAGLQYLNDHSSGKAVENAEKNYFYKKKKLENYIIGLNKKIEVLKKEIK